uniref:Uncharacterized protein n=1 Tax=Anguilla anguilla TaxID=7936 RepID=A0A0E9RWC2_ANGAN
MFTAFCLFKRPKLLLCFGI